jgi:hypothetical protein
MPNAYQTLIATAGPQFWSHFAPIHTHQFKCGRIEEAFYKVWPKLTGAIFQLLRVHHFQQAAVVFSRLRFLDSSVSMNQKISFACLPAALFLFLLASGCQHSKPLSEQPLVANKAYGSLSNESQSARVIVIPQWHLSPQEDTKNRPRPKLPQTENQIAIYDQLAEWTEAHRIGAVIVEGCEGEIQKGYAERFNGWTLGDLSSLEKEKLGKTLTQIGIKLEARFGDELRVLCGDDLALIKKHQLILSDLRGLLGFKIRIAQFKNEPTKRKDYLATVRELLKLRPETDDEAVASALNRSLQEKLDGFEAVIGERNQKFVEAVRAARVGPSAPLTVAIVIGALHVEDLDRRLKEAGEGVVVFRPIGLTGGESDLIGQVRQLLKAQD